MSGVGPSPGPVVPAPTEPDGPPSSVSSSGRRNDEWNTAHRGEWPLERADRNFAELLQELRVTQTGVQILFAFLLTLAFAARFPSLDDTQRGVYVGTLLLAVLATALFLAPAALHRSLFRRHAKPQ